MNETGTRGGAKGARLLLGGLAAAAVVRLWIAPLRSSLSLDEFGTWWVTNGSFADILPRARLFPQSLLYAAIVWIARSVGGSSEIALRLPSLAAAGLAAYWLYRLGARMFDRETGLCAAGIFIAIPSICFAAGDARPYAFGVLATVGALWGLVRWLERARAADALGYVLLASAAVYFQFLFAAMLPAHAIYAVRRWRRGGAVGGGSLLLAAGVIVLLTAPAAWLAREAGRERAWHVFRAMPGLADLVRALLPTGAIAALAASLLVWWFAAGPRGWPTSSAWRRPSGSAGSLGLVALAAWLPALLVFAASWLSATPVFVARYVLCAIPAQALLLAWWLRGVEPSTGQRAVLAGYLAIAILARGVKVAHVNEDWRAAASVVRAENGSHPVLLSGTYTESRNLAWVQDPSHADYLLAPLEYYPAGGPLVLLPLAGAEGAEEWVGRLLDATPTVTQGFALIERSSKGSWAPWLEARLQSKGYRMRPAWDQGSLRAWIFERPPP